MRWILTLALLAPSPNAQAQCARPRADLSALAIEGRHAEAAAGGEALAHDDADCERDEVLFDAGREHAAAGTIDDALRVWRQLRSEHPASRWPEAALWLEASTLESVARYEEAASAYEDFALRYPASVETDCPTQRRCPNAMEGLQLALYLRLGLHQLGAATADVEQFERLYLRRYPREAAAVSHALGRAYQDDGRHQSAVNHYSLWLAVFDERADIDVRLRARLALAHALTELGRADRARPHLESIVRLWDAEAPLHHGLADRDALLVMAARDGAAAARVLLADPAVAAFLSTRPSGNTLENVEPWLEARRAELASIRVRLEEVARYEIPEHNITVTERIGRMHRHLVDRVRATGLPEPTADELVAPDRAAAIAAYEFCATTATQMRWVTATSERCVSALDDMLDRPGAHELHGREELQDARAAPPPLASREDGPGPVAR